MRLLLFLFVLFITHPARADCTNPARKEGTVIYNADHKVAQFCNGTDWIGMAGGSTSIMEGDTMVTGWPDAVMCLSSSPNWGVIFFFPRYMPYTDGRYWYRNSYSNQDYDIRFNDDGSFYDSTATTSCSNKSIAQLYIDGLAFNFVGGQVSAGGYNGDNLGNHTATQNIVLGTNYLSGDGGDKGIQIADDGGAVFNSGHLITGHANGALVFNSGPAGLSSSTGFHFRANETVGEHLPPYTALMRITADGNVGIGTDNPQEKLHISGISYPTIRIQETSGSSDPQLFVDGASARTRRIGLSTDGINRWTINADSSTESGTNTGSNFALYRFNDDGDYVGTPFYISRASGDVGIGTTTPTRTLFVNGDGYFIATPTNGNAVLSIRNPDVTGQGDNHTHFGYNNNGTISNYLRGDVTHVSTATFQIVGNAYKPGGGSWSASSDARLKNINGTYESGLSEIIRLNPVRFHYKADNPRNEPSNQEFIGLVAQATQKIMPEMVNKGNDGYLNLDTTPLIFALVNAIKELETKNKEQTQRIDNLERRLAQ